TSLVTLRAVTAKGSLSVSGTLIGKKNPRIVAVDGMSVDVTPEGTLVVYANVDKPGVIGHAGTILGKNQINIAAMQVGRKAIGGEAVTLINVDSIVSDDVLKQIRAIPG